MATQKPHTASPETAADTDDKPLRGPLKGVRRFLRRHKSVLWWAHSVYALGLGVVVMFFAAKGFEHARILAATLGGAFLMTLIVFRIFGAGTEQREKVHSAKHKAVQFHLMNYVLKNLYQGMLFFILPFYWKASSLDSMNGWFVLVLAVMALLATMDLIFDHILMRYRILAATYYGVVLFATVNLIIPAFFPNSRILWTLLTSAFLAVVGFWLLHFPLRSLRDPKALAKLGVALVIAILGAWLGRRAIPPVPAHVQHAAVGPQVLDDGRLALEVGRVHTSLLTDLYCVTDVVFPGGQGDRLYHVWRHRGSDMAPVRQRTEGFVTETRGIIRRRSAFKVGAMPASKVGDWTVDVVTQDDQIVGRARFTVIE